MAVFDAEYYHANYCDYARQNPRRKLNFYWQVVEQSHADGVARSIHDIGCAFGRFLDAGSSDWFRFGSDISADAISAAGLTDVTLRVASIEDQPFSDGFGAVTAFDVLEHVSDLTAAALSIRQQLAASGSFVFVVPVYDGASGPIIRYLDHDPTHIHRWPRAAWLAWAHHNFEVIDWQGIIRWWTPWRHYIHIPTRLFRRHSPAIIVACRKRP